MTGLPFDVFACIARETLKSSSVTTNLRHHDVSGELKETPAFR
jgi:hypothetical protein